MPSSFSHQFVNTRKGNLHFFFTYWPMVRHYADHWMRIEPESCSYPEMSTWKKAKQRRAERKMGDEGTGRVQHSKRELKRRHWNKDEQSVHPISDDSKIKDKWKGTHEIWKKKKSHMQLASASVCVCFDAKLCTTGQSSLTLDFWTRWPARVCVVMQVLQVVRPLFLLSFFFLFYFLAWPKFNQVVSGNTTALSASRGQSEEPDQQSIHWLDHFCIGWQSIRGRGYFDFLFLLPVTSENSDENQARAGSGRTGCKVSRRKEKKGGKNGWQGEK